MLIRHKLVLFFIVFSGLLLACFSIYIYVASARSRKEIFQDRLRTKALYTREIFELHNNVAEKIITTIPEQSEYVLDENGRIIFAINNLGDYAFDSSFFKAVATTPEYYFRYKEGWMRDFKEGYAFTFEKNRLVKTVAITAYDKGGFEQLRSLEYILIIGNIFFLAAVGLTAFIFSTWSFKPINYLVAQAESIEGHDLNFRLTYNTKTNEIGIVAASFNRVLDRMQSVVESQKSFISYASHELRTPLAAINGILETSLNYDKSPAEMKESLRAAHKEIKRATILVNGLLQLAKIESASKHDERIQINIIDLILDAISFYKLKSPNQVFDFDIPVISEGIYIEACGYPQLLRTAIINVIDNASKYSQQQPISIKLDKEEPMKIRIRIKDSGIGISNSDHRLLFDVFFRGSNASGFSGFGLGLALTQKILAIHHGEIRLYRNEKAGVTAEIVLPAMIH